MSLNSGRSNVLALKSDMPSSKPSLLRRTLKKSAQAVRLVLPAGFRKKLVGRIYYSIFQSTRVTNDAYGWRPEEKENSP